MHRCSPGDVPEAQGDEQVIGVVGVHVPADGVVGVREGPSPHGVVVPVEPVVVVARGARAGVELLGRRLLTVEDRPVPDVGVDVVGAGARSDEVRIDPMVPQVVVQNVAPAVRALVAVCDGVAHHHDVRIVPGIAHVGVPDEHVGFGQLRFDRVDIGPGDHQRGCLPGRERDGEGASRVVRAGGAGHVGRLRGRAGAAVAPGHQGVPVVTHVGVDGDVQTPALRSGEFGVGGTALRYFGQARLGVARREGV